MVIQDDAQWIHQEICHHRDGLGRAGKEATEYLMLSSAYLITDHQKSALDSATCTSVEEHARMMTTVVINPISGLILMGQEAVSMIKVDQIWNFLSSRERLTTDFFQTNDSSISRHLLGTKSLRMCRHYKLLCSSHVRQNHRELAA